MLTFASLPNKGLAYRLRLQNVSPETSQSPYVQLNCCYKSSRHFNSSLSLREKKRSKIAQWTRYICLVFSIVDHLEFNVFT
uniref:Uncharacterized protein n=1 Tax=Oryza brachyantha TaxID=4533 RepID=J3L9W2_ORYBR